MLANWVVIVAAFGYIGLLFAIASYGDRVSGQPRGRAGVLIYPLSLAIYCTSWTFFGSVGLATRTGIEFLAIYAGPILMVGLGTPLLMRVVRLAKTHNITSIADFIAARYGKSQAVAATVAIIALIGSIPYIALQLKAVASSLETVHGHRRRGAAGDRRRGADRDVRDGDVRRAVRHAPRRRDRAPERPDPRDRDRVDRQAVRLHRRRRVRDVLDVRPDRAAETGDRERRGEARAGVSRRHGATSRS